MPFKSNHSFGNIAEDIFIAFDRNAGSLVESILESLVDGTPRTTGTGTPVDTGALKANWHAGIVPQPTVIERPKDGKKNSVPYKKPKVKRYGIHKKYFIWNNSEYLSYVNAGIAGKAGVTPYSSVNIGFVGKALEKGIQNAIGRGY